MKYARRFVYCLLLTAARRSPAAGLGCCTPNGQFLRRWLFFFWRQRFLWVNLRPIPKSGPTKRIQRLAEGCELLWLFCVAATATVLPQLRWLNVLHSDIARVTLPDWWGYLGGAMGVLLAVTWRP